MTRSRAIRALFAGLAVVFFAMPLALLAAGVGARAFENRRLAPAPRLADGWKFFDDATRYLIDRLPLRDQAVRANTWIDQNIFATTPRYGLNGLGGVANDLALPFTGKPAQDKAGLTSTATTRNGAKTSTKPAPTADQVAVGLGGWLYLQGVFDRACSPFIRLTLAAARWEALLSVIRASGRRVELLVTPDKSTVYPEHVATNTSNLACGRAGTAALWRIIEGPAARHAGILGLRKPLLAAKLRTNQPLYFRTDSHWNTVGSLALVQAALPALSRTLRVLPSEIVDTGPVKYSGDLLTLLGIPGSEIAPTLAIRRASGAPVVVGRTVIVGDSYAEEAMGELGPYFASISLLYWLENTPQQIADGIASARNVVLQTVEREFDYRATTAAYITPQFIALVRATLAAHPLGRH